MALDEVKGGRFRRKITVKVVRNMTTPTGGGANRGGVGGKEILDL